MMIWVTTREKEDEDFERRHIERILVDLQGLRKVLLLLLGRDELLVVGMHYILGIASVVGRPIR
jgi:hypothetical protein